MNKLTQIEAERVISVLEDAHLKLTNLSFVQLDLIPQPEMLTPLLGEENEMIAHTILEHKMLEDQYEDLFIQSKELRAPQHKKARDTQTELKTMSDSIKDSTRNIARLLQDHGDVVKRLQHIVNEVPGSSEARAPFAKFFTCFYDLRLLAQDKLQTTVEQERDKHKKLEDIDTKAKKVSLDKTNLEKELTSERRKHETESRMLDDTIHKLDLELQELSTRYQGAKKQLEQMRATQSSDDLAQHESTMRALEEQRKRREEELVSHTADDRLHEKELRNKKRITEEGIEHQIRSYEKLIQDKQAEYDTKKKMVADDIKEIEELSQQADVRERRKRLDAYKKRDEENEAREKKELAERFARSVAILQNLFRRRRDTRIVEALKKKRGKSRKGKKGGKKKR
ncbi:hypothetical protein PAPYR_11157 [Paratrimastix pyriformis]|uniref:Dynein regulatory complex protein 10 n=1 Tax=Paratrimastix pyriformis TaxID=342808 RepID=A0ABQ8U687_9EUKA|nr:hypothetical protein PAPYR_11157 [Paratrimastix pyriformis]